MERVKDMMALLDEQLVPLKEGAEKAKRYKSLTQEKRAIDATMGLLKLTSSGRMTARYENEALKLQDEGSLWQTKLSQASLAKETLVSRIRRSCAKRGTRWRMPSGRWSGCVAITA